MPEPNDKKKTVKLKVAKDIHFKMIGISCHENDYRLVWAINENMKLQFLRIGNLVVHNTKIQEDLEFSRYLFDDEDRYMKYYLIANRCPDGFLFPEVRNLDFVLQIVGEITPTELKELETKIKSIDVVSTAFILQPEKIKGIREITFEV
ncbi:MAG TPA: IPExxxVDY family protein [Bacteroidales bacterium]|nr:IPExxxVDY family protein [Bacteroidales bacterium]